MGPEMVRSPYDRGTQAPSKAKVFWPPVETASKPCRDTASSY